MLYSSIIIVCVMIQLSRSFLVYVFELLTVYQSSSSMVIFLIYVIIIIYTHFGAHFL